MNSLQAFALCLAGVVVAPRAAIGDPAPVDDETTTPAAQPPKAEHSALRGAFLPYTIGPSTDSRYANFLSGFDGARRAFVYDGAADASVVGGLSVRAGYSSSDLSGHASALLGARYQFLSQERHGVDLGAGLFYLPQGIDGEGLVRGSVFVGTAAGSAYVLGSGSYGQDPEGDDHHAEFSVATLFVASPRLLFGADARVRALVLTSDEKHYGMTEPIVDIAVGPVAHYVLGPLVLTGEVGASSIAMRGPHGSFQPSTEMRYGLLSLLSAGFVL